MRPTLEDETDAKLGDRRHRGRSSSWCSEPENELDRGHFELLIVRMTFAVWSTLYRIPYGSTPRWRRHWGGSHGSDVSALCRSGRAQGDGGCVRAHRGGRRRI